MNTLSPSQLFERAPAAQPLPRKRSPGLIDTNEFIDIIKKKLGHRPVMAVQGRAHSDVEGMSKRAAIAKRERHGRHLIVCANAGGVATIVLNSHTVRRKAWIAAGYYRSNPELLLVGVALPLQRWRGYDAALEELERYRAQVSLARAEMRLHKLTWSEIDAIARKVSAEAYLPGHKPIGPDQLIAIHTTNVYDGLFTMLQRVVSGNLPAVDKDKRKVKPIKGPDALMHAGNVLFNIGLDYIETPVALPKYRKT